MFFRGQIVMKKIFVYVSVTLIFIAYLNARVDLVKSVHSFNKTKDRAEVAVALFYKKDHEIKKDKELYKNIKTLERTFSRLEDTKRYEYANLRFLQINVSDPELQELISMYQIDQYPTIIIFVDGKPVKTKSNQLARVTGFISYQAMRDFIENSVGTVIDDIVQDKQAARRSGPRIYPYYSFGYYSPYYYPPYWGYNPYYYQWPYPNYGNVGFGINVGF